MTTHTTSGFASPCFGGGSLACFRDFVRDNGGCRETKVSDGSGDAWELKKRKDENEGCCVETVEVDRREKVLYKTF